MNQESLFLLFDLVGTFAFAMSGAFKAIRKNLDLLGILVLGFATAMGGGIVRDALLHRIPVSGFLLFSAAGFQPSVVSTAAFLTTLLLRTAAIFLGWSLPKLR